MTNQESYTNEFYVAGVKFRKDWKKNLEILQEGETVDLIPEPENPYDKFAVKIKHCNVMLGYVPKIHSEQVSRLLPNLKATIVELAPDFEPWKALKVRIEEVSD